MVELVVARYKEDITWLKEFTGHKHTVYNKFEGDNLLPNIGFEAQTYLHHIVTRYEDLSEFTVFTQGNPFGHITKDKFCKHLNAINSNRFIPFTFKLECSKDGCPNHCGLPLSPFYEKVFGKKCPDYFVFYPFAIFSVPKKIIQRHSKSFYEKLLKMIHTKADACIMERLWQEIFSSSIKLI